ncbi:MAG: SpaA isopeptide-forming pilin-related protein, partial [Peptoniphilaceae bacterium]
MKTAMKRVASLLLALIMILEVVAPGVVEARSAGQNRATVSDDVFIPPDGNRIDPDQNAGSHLPNFIDPDDDGYYTPPQKTPARPAQNAPAQVAPKQGNEATDADVEVSEEKAPKPLIEDEADRQEKALEFSKQKELARAKSPQGGIENKKFTIITRFDTSTAQGPIRKGQYFVIHLDDKLTVKNPTSLNSISHNGKVITEKPKYNSDANTITYKIREDITENIQVPIQVEVDYNTKNIDAGEKTFTVVNSISGLGVVKPKKLLPVVVDSNGNMLSTILEPGRDDVVQVLDQGKDYKVNIDAFGDPVVQDGKIAGIRWNVRVSSTVPLTTLGYTANFTAVKGSGLGAFEDIQVNSAPIPQGDLTENDIVKHLGIVDSRHHTLGQSMKDAKDLYYTFYTPVKNDQASYMLDLSMALKDRKKVGAVRLVLPQGYSQEAIREATPTRVGMNNRTTILGEFANANQARWTITDAVSTGDEGNLGLPLETRTLKGNQNSPSVKAASYKLDPNTGEMVVAQGEHTTGNLPAKESNPAGNQTVGTIAVYEVTTDLNEPQEGEEYSLSGVTISQCQDMYIEQDWTLPDGVRMPPQEFDVRDAQGNSLGSYKVPGANEANKDKRKRKVTVPGVKYWKIEDDGTAVERGHKIVQIFDPETVTVGGTEYKFYERFNYYDTTKKVHYLHDEASDVTTETPASFTVIKVDKDDLTKTLPGARFRLQSGKNPAHEIVTDANGKATFANVKPGTYSLVEQKAPVGYKLDQETKIITVSRDGEIAVTGGNVTISGQSAKTQLVEHNAYPNWPDYMNAMHYGKLGDNGEVEFYLYLKPRSNQYEGSTDRDTRLNISIPDVNVTDVTAYKVPSWKRSAVRGAMENQEAQNQIPNLGANVINDWDNNRITGASNITDQFTQKTGYQIYFPKQRFANDEGYLIRVKANVGNKDMANLSYDWLTDRNTANETRIQQDVVLTKQGNGDVDAVLTMTNESFPKQDVSVTKVDPEKEVLPGATFVIKDENNKIIASKRSDEKGLVNFSQMPPGRYVVEETIAPDGYLTNGVVFDVTVKEDGQVTYKARFKDGYGTPTPGKDYLIENEDVSQAPDAGKVTRVYQHMKIKEDSGAIGIHPNVWEAYRYESLDYHADIEVSDSKGGTRFVIQFDPNLDFTQYVKEIPKIKNKDGVVIADPYMDFQTNRLTYVFNKNSKGGVYTGTIDIVGIIPNKYFAQNDGVYEFTNVVAPGVTGIQPILNDKGEPKGAAQTETISVRANYEQYDQGNGSPVSQSFYFGDVYRKGNDRYVDVIAYYNPLGDFSGGSYTLGFSWASTEYGGNANIVNWYAKGYEPAFKLNSVKIYRTLPRMDVIKDPGGNSTFDKKVNLNMPLSFGVRPEQDPYTYQEVYNRNIDPNTVVRDSSHGFTLNYDPGKIQMNRAQIKATKPLTIKMPNISPQKEGYIIKQTFKITDENAWKNLWRVFYMGNGTRLESGFANKARAGEALADQTGQEIPTYSVQKAKLINRKYTPGHFSIHKVSRLDHTKNLPGAVFELTDGAGKVYRRQSGDDGLLSFNNIAPGNYELKEVKAPEGYTSSATTWQVSVDLNGKVTIIERGIGGTGNPIVGDNITLEVTNNPVGKRFRVYKKDVNGKPLAGAKFKITRYGEGGTSQEATSNTSGVVEFGTPLADGTYVLEEIEAPGGYKKLDQKWVVVVEGDSVKIYNYTQPGTTQEIKSILTEEGTHWVRVDKRPIDGWNIYDNRLYGYTGGHSKPYKLGTRIIAINKDKNYVIQRYVINPEGAPIPASTATIHREKPRYTNMDWYEGTEVVKAFKLDKPITVTDVEDIRLAGYNITEIPKASLNPRSTPSPGEPNRMMIDLPATNTPIVVDVKIPYKDENGGVGTGMDLTYDNMTYWKSDYYERVTNIVVGDATVASGEGKDIIGSYIADGSLDIENDLKRYGFKLKKVKKGDEGEVIEGAAFKLTGPDPKQDERYMVTKKNGVIEFSGLEPGKYTLEEVEAAPGYETVKTNWTVTVKKDGKVYIKDNDKSGNTNVRSVDDFNAVANRISPLNRLNKLDKAFGVAEAPLAQAEEAKESAGKAEAPITTTEAKNAANAGDAEAENKNAAPSQASATLNDQISTTKQLDNFLTTFGENSGLELGEETIPSPVGAESDWEDVDPARSVGKDRRQDPKDEAPMDTKILAINKVDKRFKQAFIYGEPSIGAKPRVIQIHSWNDAFDVTTRRPNWTNVKVYQVTNGSIDNPGTKTDITKRVTWNPINNQETGYKFRLKSNVIPATIKGWILVEVDTPYSDGLAIGLGSNYTSNDAATLHDKKNYQGWLAESYPNAGSINQQAIKHKVIVNQPAQGGTISANPTEAEENTLVTLSANPADGWEFVQFNVTANGQPVEVKNNQFTMPASDVSVTAEFRKQPKLYTITTQNDGNGSVTANTQQAKENDPITLNVNANPGYELNQLTVTDDKGNPVHVDDATKTFRMPASNVKVNATFKLIPPQTYTIGIAPMENGGVTADKGSAAAGDTVKLTVTPSEGYELEKLTVTANGQPVDVTNDSFIMPAANVSISATFKKKDVPPEDEGILIEEGKFAQITNEQVGLQLKLFKRSLLGESLPNAKFTLKKTDANYENPEAAFGPYTAVSNKGDGSVVFVDEKGKPLLLGVGHYLLTETEEPTGYKKQSAPWKIEVKEINGRLVAEYRGPEETPSSFIDKEERSKIQGLTETPSGIKYAARTTFINTEGKTYVQRIYVDTRGYKGTGKVNVQINPVVKREEIDTPGAPPKTTEQGVKTAYRTTYEITDTNGLTLEAGSPDMQKIMSVYDLSRPNVQMVNTARWRPFDWGFDEDQINLNKGVYFIDVEGYYDDNIIKDHEAKIKLNIDFYTERNFEQIFKKKDGSYEWKVEPGGSYQKGNEQLGVKDEKGNLTEMGKAQPEGQKYPNWISKEFDWNGRHYQGGRVTDGTLLQHVETTMKLAPLYTSGAAEEIPKEGLILENDEQAYNITFSKHGRKDPKWDITGDEVTENRLEGAVFKLEQLVGFGWEDVEGSYVSSAFNGYFGFRNLKPGRYRLKEVQAPKGYTTITEPLLYFTVAYTEEELHITDDKTGKEKIIPGKSGYITMEYDKGHGIYQYVNDQGVTQNAKLIDFVTSGTAKNMGKIVNEKPGKGEVTIQKLDENGHALKGKRDQQGELTIGARFKLTRLSAKQTEGTQEQSGVYYGTVGEDGNLVFKDLIIGNYKLEEVDPHPGHINNGQVWYFTVGGKGLDPYADDTSAPNRDITKMITLSSSKMTVQRPQKDDDSNDNTVKWVRPHYGAGLEFANEFTLKKGFVVQPGDYFTLKLSDNIDLHGIHTNKVDQLDIFADGVGTIAKANYDAEKGTVTYTFTKYANQYELTDFSNRLSA